MSEISFNDHGLVEDMQKLAERFNADTYDYVKKEGLHLRKNVAQSFAAETDVRDTRKSLGKTTSYKQEVSLPVRNYRSISGHLLHSSISWNVVMLSLIRMAIQLVQDLCRENSLWNVRRENS